MNDCILKYYCTASILSIWNKRIAHKLSAVWSVEPHSNSQSNHSNVSWTFRYVTPHMSDVFS